MSVPLTIAIRWVSGLLLLTVQFAAAFQSDLAFERLRSERGDFRATVYTILQSRSGFLYFGTSSGLFRYDGYTLREIKDPFDRAGLSGGFWVTALAEDVHGQLWIGTQPHGLLRLDGTLSTVQRINNAPEPHKDLPTVLSPQCIAIGADGKILYGGTFGLRRVEPNSGAVEDLGHLWVEGGFGEAPLCDDLAVDPEGSIFAATGIGTYRITSDDATGGMTISRISDQPSMSLLLGSDGMLWIGTSREDVVRIDGSGGVHTYRLRSPRLTSEVHDRAVRSLLEDEHGTVWAGTMLSGLHRFNTTAGLFERVKQDELSEIRSMAEDRSNVLWIGTRSGVMRAVGRERGFIKLMHDPQDEGTLPHNDVHGIVQLPGGDLWVATSGGLARVDLQTTRVWRQGGKFGYLTSLVADQKQNLWTSAYGAGVLRVSPGDGSVRSYRHDPADTTTLSSDFVSSMFVSSRGVLYVGSSFGVDAMSVGEGAFRRLHVDTDERGNPRKNGVMGFCEDGDGRIWCATFRGGVLVYDPRDGSVERYGHDADDDRSLSSDQVFTVAFDGRTVWAGTGAGLCRYNQKDRRWERIPGEGLLQGKPIYGILFHDETELWASSEEGLFRIRLALEGGATSTFFGPVHGVPAGAYEPESACLMSDGRMLFGGVNGLVSFLPDEVRAPRTPPSVVLTGVRTVEGPVLDFESLGKVNLSYDDPFVTFECAVLDYADPDRNEYAYRLDGFDEDWIQAGTRRYVTYTNLDPGDYLLRVRGASALGVWSQSGATVSISVAPPFWGTWWFRILGAATVLVVVVVLYRYRVNRLLELERIRIRIASDLHDEVGSTLTKVALYSDLLREGARTQSQGGIIDKIGELSREAISTMSDIVWSIDARNDSMGEMLIRMKDTAEGLLGAQNIEFEFVESGLDSAGRLSPTVRENLYLILKEAVHNAVKHSRATKVRVSVQGERKGMVMSIEDNGKGIDPDPGRKGNGLRNMAMRAERIGATFTLTGPPGTTIIIRKRLL